MIEEVAVAFDCQGDQLVGVLALPLAPPELGVVILVGGPQYRAGSHRQFVHLARFLAQRGCAVLRFDFRGMGDSTGEPRSFEEVDTDIRAGIDFLHGRCPSVRRTVLWGLCDGATAAGLYGPNDSRVAGIVLANPWARSSETQARTMLTYYYFRRALSSTFWRKLMSSRVDIKASTSDLLQTLASLGSRSPKTADFRVRFARALSDFDGKLLFLICERDLTAREFEAFAQGELRAVLARREGRDTWVRFPNADHTFSGSQSALQVAQRTAGWLLLNLVPEEKHWARQESRQ